MNIYGRVEALKAAVRTHNGGQATHVVMGIKERQEFVIWTREMGTFNDERYKKEETFLGLIIIPSAKLSLLMIGTFITES